MTDQDEVKAQHDSIRDATAFETLPPIKVMKRVGGFNKIGPGVYLPVTSSADYEFMAPPPRPPQTAFNLIAAVEKRHCAYFGVMHEAVPPQKTQMVQQALVNNWLMSWREVFRQMFSLCVQYLTPEEIASITGGAQLDQSVGAIHDSFDFSVRFDVQDLNQDYIEQKVKYLTSIKQMDSGGVLDSNAIIKMLIQAIAPEMASELILDQSQAAQKMYQQVQSDVGGMMLGNEALYQENDPAAKAKLGYLQDIISKNTKAQSLAQQDENFQQLLQNYAKSLNMSVMQQENAQIGRIGVKPVNG